MQPQANSLVTWSPKFLMVAKGSDKVNAGTMRTGGSSEIEPGGWKKPPAPA